MSFPDDTDPFHPLRKDAVPAPSEDARARALAAGGAAFAAAQEKTVQATQGSGLGRRLKSIITSLGRISIMDMRVPVGTAAIALLVLPLGWQLYQTTALTPPAFSSQEAEPAVDVAEAPAVSSETQLDTEVPQESAADMLMEAAPEPLALPAPASPMPAQRDELGRQALVPMAVPAPTGVLSQGEAALPPPQSAELTGDSFTSFDEQRLKIAAEEPVSTFSIDVDTASYSYVRRMLDDGFVPEPDAVRIEELINYFPYDYPAATDAAAPFEPSLAVFPTPWNRKTQILRIGIKGFETPVVDRRSNLVFLIDTSGSMDEPDKLPLLKHAFGLLLDQLGDDDTVSIVTYAGSAGVALEPTGADEKAKILAALDQLWAGGSTAGAEGIELAYRLAEEAQIEGGTNRVILATDGDFNVGIDDPERLENFIAGKRESGISLSVLGFGRGNLDDATMQALAQNGNGNASYISSFSEARKVLVEELGGTLHTIAKDVKIQVEFNPARISEYRLIGYETRALNREDFNNDAVDAGDIGAGHTVTALYEITPVGEGQVDPLRYGASMTPDGSTEIAFLKIRYKLPDSDVSQLIEVPVTPEVVFDDIVDAGADAQFATAVAAFGQKLKGSVYGTSMSWEEIRDLAQHGRGADEGGYRAEFAQLVDAAVALQGR